MNDFIPESLRDTIIVFVRDTVSQSDMIEAYKELIASQQQNYNFLIIAVISIFTVIIGGTIWWNYKASKEQLISKIRKVFDYEKESMIDEVGKSIERRILISESEIIRLFVLGSLDVDNGATISNYINHALLLIIKSVQIEDFEEVRWKVDGIIERINILKTVKKLKYEFIAYNKDRIKAGNYNYTYKALSERINLIPDILKKEKQDILVFFNEIKDQITPEEENEEEKKSQEPENDKEE